MLKIIVGKGSVLSQGISSLELTTQCPCLLHFDKTQCLERMDFNPIPCAPKWLFGKCFCHLNARSQKVMLAAEEKKAIGVRPITLAIATCQMEQIEFVFLRWLVGALNSVLVALLIKAVKANLFSCEPRRLKSAPGSTLYIH